RHDSLIFAKCQQWGYKWICKYHISNSDPTNGWGLVWWAGQQPGDGSDNHLIADVLTSGSPFYGQNIHLLNKSVSLKAWQDWIKVSARPAVTNLSPTSGPNTGGQSVTITGANMFGVNTVLFGSTPGTSVSVIDNQTVTVITPAVANSLVDVTLSKPGPS